jgi:hypothetical protein
MSLHHSCLDKLLGPPACPASCPPLSSSSCLPFAYMARYIGAVARDHILVAVGASHLPYHPATLHFHYLMGAMKPNQIQFQTLNYKPPYCCNPRFLEVSMFSTPPLSHSQHSCFLLTQFYKLCLCDSPHSTVHGKSRDQSVHKFKY